MTYVIDTNEVRRGFSHNYWLQHGMTRAATEESLVTFDRWYESEKRKHEVAFLRGAIRSLQDDQREVYGLVLPDVESAIDYLNEYADTYEADA